MSHNEFVIICHSRAIDPGVALENPAVKAALKANNYRDLVKALDEEF